MSARRADAGELHPVVERAAENLPEEVSVGMMDCSKKLPSGKTAVERFNLKPMDPVVLLAANGKTPRQVMPADMQVTPHQFDCDDDDDLPSATPELSPDQWAQVHLLHVALETLDRHEARTGVAYPVTYDEMQCGAEVPRILLGAKIWGAAYSSPPTG
ncbi:MAG: hypothetical protein VX152_12325, partial [Pseudomonadota bacterium]|nr:hypothetical protein [Pseudomonadota bacterium]